jgi:outer membrane receptor protein involved in Fe transport
VLNPPFKGYYLDKDYMFKTFGFYAGDDYRATSRLTLNLGLRYEFMTIPHELYGRSSIIPDLGGGSNVPAVGRIFNRNWTKNNVSPRVGFAWDARGNGKTAVRGGFGVYFDIANIGSMLTQAANGVPPFAAQTQTAITNAPFAPPFIDVNGVLNPAGAITTQQFGHSLQMSDPNLKNPHVMQYNLTVEQQLPGGMGLSVSYVGNHGINLFALV